MSNLALNQNQLNQTAVIGMVTRDQQPNTQACQINPASAAAVISAGQSVKLVATAGPQIIVDVITDPTDGPVYGVINYNMRKNYYVAGDMVGVSAKGNVVMMKSSAAINRGARVSVTNQTVTTNDPTVATDVTAAHYTAGVALGQASGANQLIAVQIDPGLGNAGPFTSVSP